jgi:hypothetical protein
MTGIKHRVGIEEKETSFGWWFGIFLIFPYIGKFIIPTDEVIFFRGVGIPPTSLDLLVILWMFPLVNPPFQGSTRSMSYFLGGPLSKSEKETNYPGKRPQTVWEE